MVRGLFILFVLFIGAAVHAEEVDDCIKRAKSLYNKVDLREVNREFQLCLMYDRYNPEAQYWLAKTYHEIGNGFKEKDQEDTAKANYRSAISWIKKAIRSSKRDDEIYVFYTKMLDIYQSLGDTKGIAEAEKKVKEYFPKSQEYYKSNH